MKYTVKEMNDYTQIEFRINGLLLLFQDGEDVEAFSPLTTVDSSKIPRKKIEKACTQLEEDGYMVDQSLGVLSQK